MIYTAFIAYRCVAVTCARRHSVLRNMCNRASALREHARLPLRHV